MTQLLKKYSEYNLWANRRLLNRLNTVPVELLNKDLKSSFRSITLTVLHIYDAEYIWVDRLNGKTPDNWPSSNFTGNPYDALKLLESSSFQLYQKISSATDEYLSGRLNYKDMKGNPYTTNMHDIFQHVFNHSTFHRGQIITMLRELDVTNLPSTDYIAFTRQ
jgi:uncharacterized damage-inducible protein DinB